MDHFVESSIDPREYDISELKDGAPGGSVAHGPVREGREGLPAGHYRELLMLQSAAGKLEKPYLESMPATYHGELTAFDWLEFLVETAGFKRTYDALRYYRSVGWITDDVERQLHEYLAGLPEPDSGEARSLDQSDHLRSLVYVGRLASR